jgi:hypothetical protein
MKKMKKMEFFEIFIEKKPEHFVLHEEEEEKSYSICNDDGCDHNCIIRAECDATDINGSPKFSKRQLKKVTEKYPEYFV